MNFDGPLGNLAGTIARQLAGPMLVASSPALLSAYQATSHQVDFVEAESSPNSRAICWNLVFISSFCW
jgi:hypothetical protein